MPGKPQAMASSIADSIRQVPVDLPIDGRATTSRGHDTLRLEEPSRNGFSGQEITPVIDSTKEDVNGQTDGSGRLHELELEAATKIRSKLRLSAVLAGLSVRLSPPILQLVLILYTNNLSLTLLANPLNLRSELNNRFHCDSNDCSRTPFGFWVFMDWWRLSTRIGCFGAHMVQALRYLGTKAHTFDRCSHVFYHVYHLRIVKQYENAYCGSRSAGNCRRWTGPACHNYDL